MATFSRRAPRCGLAAGSRGHAMDRPLDANEARACARRATGPMSNPPRTRMFRPGKPNRVDRDRGIGIDTHSQAIPSRPSSGTGFAYRPSLGSDAKASLRRRDVMINDMLKRQVQWVLGAWMVALALAGCGTATGAAVGAGTGAAV